MENSPNLENFQKFQNFPNYFQNIPISTNDWKPDKLSKKWIQSLTRCKIFNGKTDSL